MKDSETHSFDFHTALTQLLQKTLQELQMLSLLIVMSQFWHKYSVSVSLNPTHSKSWCHWCPDSTDNLEFRIIINVSKAISLSDYCHCQNYTKL